MDTTHLENITSSKRRALVGYRGSNALSWTCALRTVSTKYLSLFYVAPQRPRALPGLWVLEYRLVRDTEAGWETMAVSINDASAKGIETLIYSSTISVNEPQKIAGNAKRNGVLHFRSTLMLISNFLSRIFCC